jgi:hypothetical protein
MNNYYVYQYLRENGAPYYIGKGKGNRAYINNRTTPKPADNNRIQLIKENLSEEDAFRLEIELIAYHGRKDLGTGILRNLTNGGEGVSGRIATIETIEKRVAKNTGKKRTVEQKERMRLSQLNRKEKTADEIKAISDKISNNRKGKGTAPKSDEHKKKLSEHFTGKSNGPRSEETKQKMRKPKSDAHRKAISEGRKAKYAALREQK